jgi:glycosyltransferase involved in cell wall biosynthesis
MPEVTGDAALLVPAEDTEALEAAIQRVLEDSALRERLIERGRNQVRRFSWNRCAQATMDVYRSLA